MDNLGKLTLVGIVGAGNKIDLGRIIDGRVGEIYLTPGARLMITVEIPDGAFDACAHLPAEAGAIVRCDRCKRALSS